MARPVVVPKKPLDKYKILEGAAVLLEVSCRLDDSLKAGKPKLNNTEITNLAYITRLTARTVDDLVYIIEKQEMMITELNKLLEKTKS